MGPNSPNAARRRYDSQRPMHEVGHQTAAQIREERRFIFVPDKPRSLSQALTTTQCSFYFLHSNELRLNGLGHTRAAQKAICD